MPVLALSRSAPAAPFACAAWSAGGLLALLLLAGAAWPAAAQVPLHLLHRVDRPGQNAFEGHPLPEGTTVVVLDHSAGRSQSLESAGVSRKALARRVLVRLRSRDTTVRLTDAGRTLRRYPTTAQSGEILYVLARTPADSLFESYVNADDGFVPGFDAVRSGRMTMGPVRGAARRRYRAVFRLRREEASEASAAAGTSSTGADQEGQGGPRFRVQLYAGTEQKAAESFRSKVRTWWSKAEDEAPSNVFGPDPPLTVEHARPYYRVHFGAFSARPQARRAQVFLRQEYPEAFVVRTAPPRKAAEAESSGLEEGRPGPRAEARDTASVRAPAAQGATPTTALRSGGDGSASRVWVVLLSGLIGTLVGGGVAWLILSDRLQRAEEDRTDLQRQLRKVQNQEFRAATGSTLSAASDGDEDAPSDSTPPDKLEQLREENETLERQIEKIKRHLQDLRDTDD